MSERRQPSDVLEIARLEDRVEALEKELLWWRERCETYRSALEYATPYLEGSNAWRALAVVRAALNHAVNNAAKSTDEP